VHATIDGAGTPQRGGEIRVEADPRWGIAPMFVPVTARVAFDVGGLVAQTLLGAAIGAVVGFGLAQLPLLALGVGLALVVVAGFFALLWWMPRSGHVLLRRERRIGINVMAGVLAGVLPIGLAMLVGGDQSALLGTSLRAYLGATFGSETLGWALATLPGALVGATWGGLYRATRVRAGYTVAWLGTAAALVALSIMFFVSTRPTAPAVRAASAPTPVAVAQPTSAPAASPIPTATEVALVRATTSDTRRRVRNEIVNLRAEPGAAGVLLQQIRRGTEVRLLGEERAVEDTLWVRVQIDDLRGWVRADLLEVIP
jgi:hypothetical protein